MALLILCAPVWSRLFALEVDAGAAEFFGKARANCSGVGRPAKFLRGPGVVLESLRLTSLLRRRVRVQRAAP